MNDHADVFILRMSTAYLIKEKCEKILSQEQAQQFRRYVYATDSHNFAIHTALEKVILSRYTERSLNELDIRRTCYGKPFVEMGKKSGDLPFHYSKSHSGDIVVIAVAPFEVGLDIEQKGGTGNEEIFEDVFHHLEFEGQNKQNIFYEVWTMKEAYLKLRGSGLYEPMNKIQLQKFGYDYHVFHGTNPNPVAKSIKINIDDSSYSCHLCISVECNPQIRITSELDTLHLLERSFRI